MLEVDFGIFKNVIFDRNEVISQNSSSNEGQRAIEIMGSIGLVSFDNCQFSDNVASFTTPNVYMNRAAYVEFKTCRFRNGSPPESAKEGI